MRFSLRLFFCMILPAALCGCTHNGGDIGPLFGDWVLTSMTVDGDTCDADGPDVDTFMQFQGSIVMTKLIDDRHSTLVYSVGTWERASDDVLLLDYTHSDNDHAPGTNIYRAPEWLLLESNAINTMQIISLDRSHMRLRHTTADGAMAEYTFRKTF